MRVDLDDYVSGATLATELVNTAPGVWHGEDQLDGVPALTRFLAEHGVTPEHAPTVDDLEAVRALRAPVRDAIEAGERPDGEADVATRAGALVARAGGPPSLTRGRRRALAMDGRAPTRTPRSPSGSRSWPGSACWAWCGCSTPTASATARRPPARGSSSTPAVPVDGATACRISAGTAPTWPRIANGAGLAGAEK